MGCLCFKTVLEDFMIQCDTTQIKKAFQYNKLISIVIYLLSTCCSGGLSNWLYQVSLTKPLAKPAEPSQVLMRLYGQTHGERALESLITDSVIFTLLSERNLGPKLHGIFPGGRIEEYIPVGVFRSY